MCACLYACMCICMCICQVTFIYIALLTIQIVTKHVYMYVCMYVCMYACMCMCMCICQVTFIYITLLTIQIVTKHVYIYTHTHTTHAHAHTEQNYKRNTCFCPIFHELNSKIEYFFYVHKRPISLKHCSQICLNLC